MGCACGKSSSGVIVQPQPQQHRDPVAAEIPHSPPPAGSLLTSGSVEKLEKAALSPLVPSAGASTRPDDDALSPASDQSAELPLPRATHRIGHRSLGGDDHSDDDSDDPHHSAECQQTTRSDGHRSNNNGDDDSPDPLSEQPPIPFPQLVSLPTSDSLEAALVAFQSELDGPAHTDEDRAATLPELKSAFELWGSKMCNSTSEPVSSSHRSANFTVRQFTQYQSIVRDQRKILPPQLLQNSLQESEIILESSVVVGGTGQTVMLPWHLSDPDIQANFYINTLPPHIQNITNQRRLLRRDSSPRKSQPHAYGSPAKSVDMSPADTTDESPGQVAGRDATHHPSLECMARMLRVDELTSASLSELLANEPSPVFVDGWDISDGRWTDPTGYMSLSRKQRQKFYAWERISNLAKESEPTACIMAERPRSSSIRQGFVGDCSFLSSLAVLAEFENTHQAPVLSSIIYPQIADAEGQMRPVVSPRGMYGCRLFFNGVPRKVLVDDYVPIRRDGKLLAAHTSRKKEYWVTILEKSFVKLMGGSYFMQGSNPGADLYHLTGWVPETLPFRADIHTGSPDSHAPIVTGDIGVKAQLEDPRWSAVWNTLYSGFTSGRCVACLGTSEVVDAAPSGLDFPEGVSQSTGIVARHAYSVLDLREVRVNPHAAPYRLLYVKNPWCCIRWRGAWSPYDETRWTKPLQKLLNYDRARRACTDDGCFWIEWSDVLLWFSHLYLCWNSRIFPRIVELHGKWDRSTLSTESLLKDDAHLLAFNPQFTLTVDGSSVTRPVEVWILLSRHVRERRRDLALKYLAVHVHAGNERLICPPPPEKQGIYSNGECTLVKLVVDPRVTRDRRTGRSVDECGVLYGRTFVLVVSQYNQKDEFNFTIKSYSAVSTSLKPLPQLFDSSLVSRSCRGEWCEETAGGCSNDMWGYFLNPHYRLYLPDLSNVTCFLECAEEHSVNVRIFKHVTATARLLRSGRVVSSGPYRSGCCVVRARLEQGIYTIIASAFRRSETGHYRLAVHAEEPKPRTVADGGTTAAIGDHYGAKKMVLQPLPHAYPSGGIFGNFCCREFTLQATRRQPFRFSLHCSVDRPTIAALRVQVDPDTFPRDVVPVIRVILLSTGGTSGRNGKSLGVVYKSDIEGGTSANSGTASGSTSRPISSAAVDLYYRQRTSILSHAILLPRITELQLNGETEKLAAAIYTQSLPVDGSPAAYSIELVCAKLEHDASDGSVVSLGQTAPPVAGSATVRVVSDFPVAFHENHLLPL